MIQFFDSLKQQVKDLFPQLIRIYLSIFIFFVLIVLIRLYSNIPIPYLTRDPISLLHGPYYYGYISKIGIIIWCAAASICFFTSYLFHGNKNLKEIKLFLLASGGITLLLLLDDFFLLHDGMLKRVFGDFEEIFVAIYATIILIYLSRFRNCILQTDFIYLALALSFFGVSILFDILQELNITLKHGHYLLEDGAKLVGILNWFIYFFKVSKNQIHDLINY